MQLLACFWITLCLVVYTSTKSITSTEEETSTGDLPIKLHRKADENINPEKCECDYGSCVKDKNGKLVCLSDVSAQTCPPGWGMQESKCEKCNCGKDSNCTFTYVLFHGWQKTCLCQVGYEDDNGVCTGTCKSKPCLNGGECSLKGNDIECKCKNSFTGRLCEKAAPCNETKDCKNGGICEKTGDGSFCRCRTGTEGSFCNVVPECADMNCGQDAECAYDIQSEKAFCQCLNNSLSFEPESKSCKRACYDDTNCTNGAECKRNGIAKFCRCLNGTKGDYCEEVSGCKDLKCEPYARCTFDVQVQKAMCLCADEDSYFDYKQRICRNVCLPNPCQNGGICNGTTGEAMCQCRDQFRGADCSIDVCSPNPCQNDGICKVTRGNVTCQCKDHFRGADCSIDVCSPTPCQNGGICKATRGQATCQCKDSFKGSDCSIDVCSPNPCQNGGICIATRGQATCHCKESFKGSDCSIDVCSPNPCQNGGHCNATRGQPTCHCRDTFTGADCSLKIPLISTSTSVETWNITRNSTIHPTHHSTSSSSGHSLNFTVSRESTLRRTTLLPTAGVDPCIENPCQNGGTCVVVGNRAKCLCKKPYLGNLCETDPCNWNPCKNGGICKTEYETVRCFCKEPFTGEFCESRIRIDMYVIALVAGSVFLAIILTFLTCILCQRYHVMRTRSEYS